jgi:hypothetical protein
MGIRIGMSSSALDRGGRQATYDGFGWQAGWWGQQQNQNRFGNPDPYYFKIKEFMQIGPYLAVKIHYPTCTNYEGNKILIFDGLTFEELQKQKAIDPHFSSTKKFKSPIARFEPTEQGWINALKFCSMLQAEHVEMAY